MLSRLKRGHSSLIVHFIVKINCTYPWETNSGLGGLTCFMQVPAHTTLLSPLWGHYGLIMYGMVRTECTVTYCFKALPRSPALEHSDLVVQVMSGSSALTTCVNFLKCKVYHVLVLSWTYSLNCNIHVIFLDTMIIGLHMYSFTTHVYPLDTNYKVFYGSLLQMMKSKNSIKLEIFDVFQLSLYWRRTNIFHFSYWLLENNWNHQISGKLVCLLSPCTGI